MEEQTGVYVRPRTSPAKAAACRHHFGLLLTVLARPSRRSEAQSDNSVPIPSCLFVKPYSCLHIYSLHFYVIGFENVSPS